MNKFFTVGVRSLDYLKPIDFHDVWNHNPNGISNFKLKELIDRNGSVLGVQEVSQNLRVPVNRVLYNKLKKIVETARIRFKKEEQIRGKDIQTYFLVWKRGSKGVRKIMTGKNSNIPHNMIMFANNTETVIGIADSEVLNTSWSLRHVSNPMRTFIFKLHNNTLAINTRLSHFIRGHSRNCTFCDLVENALVEDETVYHLFFSCDTIENIRQDFFSWFRMDRNFIISRQEYFGVYNKNGNEDENFIMFWTIKYFQYYIWLCKMRKTLPNLVHAKHFILKELNLMSKISKDFRNRLQLSHINIDTNRLNLL
jgi:hypothetical protein